ncbi:MAG: hypothetical protein ACJAV6_000221 [Candidatus Paceibacteria bacterium]|jgi:hypothetical protein
MTDFFAILSGLTLLISYILYYRQMRANVSTPNPSSWLIWSLILTINAFTYQEVLLSNQINAVTGYVAAACLIAISTYAMTKGKFSKLKRIDIFSFSAALIVGVFWQVTGDAFLSQIALQIIIIIAYMPTLIGLDKGHAKENPLSWLIVVLAYVFLMISILIEYQGNWIELLFPLVNGLIGNGLVAYFAIKKRRFT